jgi:hypothetical protein
MSITTPAARLAELVGYYSPEIAAVFTSARRKMRALIPRGYELVFENYNALGVGYGPGRMAPDAIVSIVAYPRWVTLFFLYGATLRDPDSLLEGTGSRVRSIRLSAASDLDRPAVRELIAQALLPHAERLAACPRLELVLKSVATKRRARRPVRQDTKASAKAGRKAAAKTRVASCSCGALRATVTGEPLRVSMCHCLECQRRTGSVFGAQARFPAEAVAVQGDCTEFVRVGDSGSKITFRFCPKCGSTVYYTVDDMVGLMAIPIGAFADPGFPSPVFSVYESRKHDWVNVPPDAEHMS